MREEFSSTKKRNYSVIVLIVLCFLTNSCSRILANALKLEPPENKIIVEKDIMIPMRDKIRLATDIYKPKKEGKYPVILCRLPYGKDLLGEFGKVFAQRGYIFVIQDCRACFKSEGEVFIPFVTDERDGRDTIDWIIKQPWFDGKLGLWGASYFGYTQWAIADKNPYLKCFHPQITTANLYEAIFSGGAFHYGLTTGWSAGVGKQHSSTALLGLVSGGGKKYKPEEGLFNKPLKPDLNYSFEELGRMDIEELGVILGLAPADKPNEPYPDATEKLINLFAYPGFAYHSQVFNYFDRYKEIKAPALMISGWYDIFLKGQLDDFMKIKQMAEEPARSGTRIIIGPWAHASLGYDEAEKGARAMEMYRKMFLIDWFDYWIKGEKNRTENMAPIRLYVMGKNIWRDEYEWPLARTSYKAFYLHSNGKANTSGGDGYISKSPPENEPADKFDYDPKNPVPTFGGNNLIEKAGSLDQKEIEKRKDVLVYTSEPLKEELEITGPLKVIVYAQTDARDTDFTAKLCVVDKKNRSMNLADGIIRARYRDGYDNPSFIEPHKIYKYEIDLWATSYAFQPGERIRVQISSSNFPRFDKNSNCAGEGGESCAKVAHQVIYHNREHPSHIVLPVIESGL